MLALQERPARVAELHAVAVAGDIGDILGDAGNDGQGTGLAAGIHRRQIEAAFVGVRVFWNKGLEQRTVRDDLSERALNRDGVEDAADHLRIAHLHVGSVEHGAGELDAARRHDLHQGRRRGLDAVLDVGHGHRRAVAIEERERYGCRLGRRIDELEVHVERAAAGGDLRDHSLGVDDDFFGAWFGGCQQPTVACRESQNANGEERTQGTGRHCDEHTLILTRRPPRFGPKDWPKST